MTTKNDYCTRFPYPPSSLLLSLGADWFSERVLALFGVELGGVYLCENPDIIPRIKINKKEKKRRIGHFGC